MGFEQLKPAINEGLGGEPITAEELAALYRAAEEEVDRKDTDNQTEQPDPAEVAALKLVQQNIVIAEQYVGSKRIPADMDRIDNLYRAWVAPKNWPNTNQPRAHLGNPLVLESIENIISQVHMAFWADPEGPFLLEARGKTPQRAARAMGKVVKFALKASRAKEEFRKTLKSTLLYPQGVIRWGWQSYTHSKREWCRDAEGKLTKKEKYTDMVIPCAENVELRNFFVDPGLRNQDVRNAKWVIAQFFTDGYGLQDLKDDPRYFNIPDEDQLRVILADGKDEPTVDSGSGTKQQSFREYQAEKQDQVSSADPMQQPLEILEMVTCDQVICVLQRKIVIRLEENEFNEINYNSSAFIDVLGSWFGFGIGKLLEGDQKFTQGVLNAWIDGLSIALQPVWHRKKGVGAMSQNIAVSPGKVVNDDGDLAQLPLEGKTQESLAAVDAAEARASRRIGANAGPEMPNQAMRTAEGVNAFTSGVQTRLQYFIDIWADLVFIPVIEKYVELCKEHMDPEHLKMILGDTDEQEYEGDLLEVYNGTFNIDVLPATKLAAKRAMAQLLPMLLQLFQSEPVQNALAAQKKKVDYVELVEQAMDLTGWPSDDIIVDATDEDVARYVQTRPGVMAAQLQAKNQAQQQQNALEQIEAKGTTQAGVAVVKHVLDQSAQPEPAGTGSLADELAGGQGGTIPPQGGTTSPSPQPLANQPPQPGPPPAPPANAAPQVQK